MELHANYFHDGFTSLFHRWIDLSKDNKFLGIDLFMSM